MGEPGGCERTRAWSPVSRLRWGSPPAALAACCRAALPTAAAARCGGCCYCGGGCCYCGGGCCCSAAGSSLRTWALDLCAHIRDVLLVHDDLDAVERLLRELAELLGDGHHHGGRDVLIGLCTLMNSQACECWVSAERRVRAELSRERRRGEDRAAVCVEQRGAESLGAWARPRGAGLTGPADIGRLLAFFVATAVEVKRLLRPRTSKGASPSLPPTQDEEAQLLLFGGRAPRARPPASSQHATHLSSETCKC